jgi:hypothetical protein
MVNILNFLTMFFRQLLTLALGEHDDLHYTFLVAYQNAKAFER